MIGYDFSYDGVFLSDFNCVICSFDGSDVDTTSVGSQITFKTTPVFNGQEHLLTNSVYEECLTLDLQICKNPCIDQGFGYFTIEEQREFIRWLNRKEFCELIIFIENNENLYLEGSFNIEQIKVLNQVIGYQLHFTSNRPFALGEEVVCKFDVNNSQPHIICDTSDEIGYLYPEVTITCKEAGNLVIMNSMDEQKVIVNNVSANEVIHMNNLIIESSLLSHQKTLMNDFNFHFPGIFNTYRENRNIISSSIPCFIEIKYRPVRKVGII